MTALSIGSLAPKPGGVEGVHGVHGPCLKTTLPQSCRLGNLKNHLWIHEPNHVQCQFFHWLVPNSHDCWVSISESGTRTLQPAVGLQRWVKLWAPSCVGRIMCKETDLSGETLPLLQPLPSMFAAPAPWFFSGEGYRENMGSSAPFGHFILVPMQCDIQMESRAFYYVKQQSYFLSFSTHEFLFGRQ